ncbi:TonB-dependent receptor [candidate division KSB1 bacterium]|nr:TonB-dependent receptor [candidate division KSB1 bacterium]
MKMHLFKTALFVGLILGACGFYPVVVAAPPGDIAGVIKDGQTGDPLPGANVYIVGTAIGAATDLNGRYTLKAVPAGTYTLRVTYIGYETKEVSLTVGADGQVNMDVSLVSTILESDVVVVSAQREGQVAAINQQLTADALVNIVSSEKILEVPDANAAESIARLPGVSIQRDGGEGSQVVVRGLSPKYSKVTIDGIEMAATSELSGASDRLGSGRTDTETRSTNLSAISQENLKGIALFKAPTADMDGDAIGGTVNLQTARAEATPERIARGYGSYNSLENDYEQYDVFGKISQRLLGGGLGLQLSVNTERRNRSSDLFNGSYEPDFGRVDSTTGIYPVRVTSADIEDRLETRKRTGGSLILDYNVGDGNIMLTNFYSKTTRRIRSRLQQVSTSGGGLLRIQVTDRDLEQMLNTLRGEHRLFGLDLNWLAAHSYANSEIPFEHRLNFTGTVTVPSPLEVNQNTSAIDWFNQVEGALSLPLNLANPVTDKADERNFIGRLDLSRDFTLDQNLAGMIKLGGKIKHLDRTRRRVRGQLWAYLTLPWSAMSSNDFLDNSYTPHNFLDGDADLGTVLDVEANRTFYNTYRQSTEYVVNEAWSGNNDYDIDENLYAGYVMAKLNYKQLITFVPGIRYEAVDNDYLAHVFIAEYDTPGPLVRKGQDFHVFDTTSTIAYHDWMPMVHLKVKPQDWFDLRLSLTRTIARPDFNDVMPFQTLTTNPNSSIRIGNSDIDPVRAWNYDVYASFYNSFWGLFTVGYFYKDLQGIHTEYRTFLERARADSLEQLLDLDFDRLDSQYGFSGLFYNQTLTVPRNLDAPGEVEGVEFDVQTNFRHWPVPGLLKGFVLGFNYSIIRSKTAVRDFETRTIALPVPPFFRTERFPVTREIPVPGQADRLANLTIGYDTGGFSARVSMFHQSGSLNTPGVLEEQDSYDDAFTRWDLSIRQRITSRLDAYFNVVNLTETRDRTFRFRPDRPTQLAGFGRTADLGIQFRL